MTQQNKSKGRGCLFYGGILAVMALVVVILTILFTTGYVRRVVNQFSSDKPMALPETQITASEVEQVRKRIGEFSAGIEKGRETEPLTLTANQINGLIANAPELAPLRHHLYASIPSNALQAQISMPAEELGLEPLRGRYINGHGSFNVSLEKGQLKVYPNRLVSANGQPFPARMLRAIQMRNLASDFETNAEVRAFVDHLKSVTVTNGEIVFVPKEQAKAH